MDTKVKHEKKKSKTLMSTVVEGPSKHTQKK